MGANKNMTPVPHDETIFQIILSGATAFLMAFLRSLRYARSSFLEAFAEALMCGLISAAVVPVLWSYFELSIYTAAFIGSVVGMCGVNLIYVGLLSFLPTRVSDQLPHNFDITHSNKPTNFRKPRSDEDESK